MMVGGVRGGGLHCFNLLHVLLSKQPNEVTFHKSTPSGGTFEVKRRSKLSDKRSAGRCCKETPNTAGRSVSEYPFLPLPVTVPLHR